ncbi:MAG: M13 family peptidase [Bacteroidia bacterium]|nr:M13 family peptidase [Bacteroidia bacterium]
MNKKLNLPVFLLLLSLVSIGLISCKSMKDKKNTAIDRADLDLSVLPQDDFYRFANGGWMEANPLPADRSRYGSFDALADRGDEQLRQLFNDLTKQDFEPGSNGRKIFDFYASGMQTDRVNAQGCQGIETYLNAIRGIKNTTDLERMITRLFYDGISPVFHLFADADSKNSDRMVAHLYQGGLGMPDRDYYINAEDRSVQLREAYKKYIITAFELIGDKAHATERMEHVLEIEHRLAEVSRSREALRDPDANYNPVTVSSWQQQIKNFSWDPYFQRLGVADPGTIIIGQPEFFMEFDRMLTDIDPEVWKSYLTWCVINSTAPYLSEPFEEARFAFYGVALQGQPEMLPRWKRVLNTTSQYLDEAVGQLYVQRYFPPEAKDRMKVLVANLKKSFSERIHQLDWMQPETKLLALEKLDAMRVKVGYPDKWRDYSGLEITSGSYIENVIAARRFDRKYMADKINRPVDKDEWHMPPQMVNAYYSPNGNEIVFPAAILQPPFFFLDADDAVNYGAIGVVIGHEMTHGFDDQGRKYDKEGNLNEWWTEKDAEQFEARTQLLVDQFNAFVVLDSLHANGKLTLGENIADQGGLNIAFHALKLAQENAKETIEGFTPEQRFFLAYAHVWGQNIRDEEIIRRTKIDEHSLGEYRVNGALPNIPGFYEAFDVKEGDRMFYREDRRASIW